jgi:hypothetical protein
MQRLADCRRLQAAERRRLGTGAAALLSQWLADGWVHAEGPASAGAA